MKKSNLLTFSLTALFLFAQTSPVSAGSNKNFSKVAFIGSATTKSVEGDVTWSLDNQRWQPLSAGSCLPQGAIIRTGVGGRSVLLMDQSRSLVQLPPRTLAKLRGLEASHDPTSLTGTEQQEGFTVRAVRGEASIMERGRWIPLKVNVFVKEGRAIRTGHESTIDLFSNQTGVVIRLLPSSVLVLDPAPILEAGDLQTNNKQFAATLRRAKMAASDSSRETVAVATR
jgi:hypothetical protein